MLKLQNTHLRCICIVLFATVVLPVMCSGQQIKRTEFNGFWIGMTITEFHAVEKGEAIVQAYARPLDSDCVKNEKQDAVMGLGLGEWSNPLCKTWAQVNDASVGWDFMLSDPYDLADASYKGPEYPATLYRFTSHKLTEITYVPGNETTDEALNQNLHFLTQKYGKPTSDSVITKQNGFGAITKERMVQWIQPDGTTISLSRELDLGHAPVVKFWIPDKPTKITKNPF